MSSESTLFESAIEVAPMEIPEIKEECNEVEQEQADIEAEEDEEYTPLSVSEDPGEDAAYHEYKLLEKNIKYQNNILESLKDDIKQLERKQCPTKKEKCDLKNAYDNWEREILNLQELIRKAIDFQNTSSKRQYRELRIATTFDEDNSNYTPRTWHTLQDQTYKTDTKAKRVVNTSKGSKLIKDVLLAFKECSYTEKSKEKQEKCSIRCKEKEEIKNQIKSIQQIICKLTKYLYKKENLSGNQSIKPCVTPPSSDIDPEMLCLRSNLGKTNNVELLKENYLYLLTEFNKKDDQLKKLTKRLRNSCQKCVGQGDATSVDEAELNLLRIRISEMKGEQTEFRCIMREQSLQLDEYRNKYLTAQQKVEEQCAIIEKLNMKNKCIEKQINQEVKEMRAKFQERISDLLQYPKLLESEQIKLAQVCKEKKEYENKLLIVCKELKSLKSKEQTTGSNDGDCRPLLIKCQQELGQVKKKIMELQRQRDMFCEQLGKTMQDLDAIRSESAKIIATTKERAEFIKRQQKKQINNLEKQLAQCRATANLSVSDRESIIKEMQGQLNILSYSFDAAQKQIRTLCNHIAYVSNENSYHAKL